MEPDSPLHTNLVALLIVISGMVPGTTAPPSLTESTTATADWALAGYPMEAQVIAEVAASVGVSHCVHGLR